MLNFCLLSDMYDSYPMKADHKLITDLKHLVPMLQLFEKKSEIMEKFSSLLWKSDAVNSPCKAGRPTNRQTRRPPYRRMLRPLSSLHFLGRGRFGWPMLCSWCLIKFYWKSLVRIPDICIWHLPTPVNCKKWSKTDLLINMSSFRIFFNILLSLPESSNSFFFWLQKISGSDCHGS